MNKYKVKSTSNRTANVEDIPLRVGKTTRRVFRPIILDNPKNDEHTVKGFIVHQRKSPKKEWEDINEKKLNELQAGEGVKFQLHSDEVKIIYDELNKLYKIAKKGVPKGEKEYVVAEVEEVIKVPEKRKEVIKQLLENEHSEEIWKELSEDQPDLATKLAHSKILQDRQEALNEFKSNLEKNRNEQYWQKFFEKNQWIFGYGLNYQFLHLLESQPYYGGKKRSDQDGEQGDYLMNTEGDLSFTVLVEIKKPSLSIFATKKNGEIKKYRNGVPLINDAWAGAISQIQVNCKTWEIEGAESSKNKEELLEQRIYTHKPKGILVVGHSNQLDNREKRKAFELFRRNLDTPEIITFDELYNRAKFIVNHERNKDTIDSEEKKKNDVEDLDDLPF